MALEFILESLDGVDQSLVDHYTQKDGKFVLNVNGIEKTDNQEPGDGDATEKSGYIPKIRFNEENEKRKTAEKALKEVVDELKVDIPEEMLGLIPEINPIDQIKWIRNAMKMGVFGEKEKSGPDSKRPGGKLPIDFKNMSSVAIMAKGYKTK